MFQDNMEENKSAVSEIGENTPSSIVNHTAGSKINPYVLIFSAFVVVMVVLLVGFLFLKGDSKESVEVGTDNPYGNNPAADLSTTNELYNDARFAYKVKDYNNSIKLFEEALGVATHSDEKGQIKYELALAKNRNGQGEEAVILSKEIAVDEIISKTIRASAIALMAQMYYGKHDLNIFNEIFNSVPYSSFLVEGDVDLSMKNLLEYASSLYPVAYSELRIANWYANDLVRNDGIGSGGKSVEEVKKIIREKIENARVDNQELSEIYPGGQRESYYLLRQAIIAGKLERLDDPFLGDPQDLFNQAILSAKSIGSIDRTSFAIYHFAVFLSHSHLETQSDDIVDLLSNFYGNGSYVIEKNKDGFFFIFLGNERNSDSVDHADIALLAQIDEQFKLLLNSKLRWNL